LNLVEQANQIVFFMIGEFRAIVAGILSPISILHSTGFNLCQPIQVVSPGQPDISLLHQTKNTGKMKATITILAAVFTLTSGILFAGNETFSHSPLSERTVTMLAPSTPTEATFEDATVTFIDFSSIMPSVPSEADFSDVAPETTIDLVNLTPLTPSVADFDDTIELKFDIKALAPVTPVRADFE
jgi:hypothetical protein